MRRIKLKKLLIVSFALATLLCIVPVGAQEASSSPKGDNWSAYYYVNVPIEKVYPHRLGYFVLYRKAGTELGRAYLPLKWFPLAVGKATLIRMQPTEGSPYLTVYYKGGTFSHVVLHVMSSMSHPSWGNLPQGTDIDTKFDIEELKLEY